MRPVFATVLEVAGLVAVSAAAFLVAIPLGLAVAGVSAFTVGLFLED
jgi:hypothetical protein